MSSMSNFDIKNVQNQGRYIKVQLEIKMDEFLLKEEIKQLINELEDIVTDLDRSIC
jgi:hypothetical protein